MKKAKQQRQKANSTHIAVAVAAIFGATDLYCAEIIYNNIKDSGAPKYAPIARMARPYGFCLRRKSGFCDRPVFA
jgi:hypothetical protein